MIVKIEKVVPGGAGLARVDGRVVFVSGALPGELVEIADLTGKNSSKSFGEAAIQRIVESSPGRRQAPCTFYGDCGGCDLQHADEGLQTEIKRGIISDVLRRQGRLESDEFDRVLGLMETFSTHGLGYRNRFQFHRSAAGLPGFKKRRGNDVIAIGNCAVAVPEVNGWLATSPRLKPPQHIKPRQSVSRDRYHKDPVRTTGFEDEDDPQGESGAERYPAFGYGSRVYLESDELAVSICGKTLSFSNRGFFQSNLSMLDRLVEWFRSEIEGVFAGKQDTALRAADLYCGVGLFAAFLPDRFGDIEAVESSTENTAYALKNTDASRTKVLQQDVDQWIAARNEESPALDLIVVDPPRKGLSKALRSWLEHEGPDVLAYVSCDPVTFARDLSELPSYRIERFGFFDFYPQTSRIETACLLRRRRT